MYKVYCDSFLLYTDTVDSLRIHTAKVDLEVNKTGSFGFTIHKDHPYYDFIYKMKSIITVYQDDYLLFRGRALNIEYGFFNEKIVKCEGELAFLLDSVVRPYTFSGTVTEYLTMLINSHNAQVEAAHRFAVGRVTVTDSNNYITRSDEDYVSTWKLIEDKLIDNLGGYILVRHEGDVSYIDYLSDFTLLSSQQVEFGKNLLSFKRAVKGENIATALIPLGAKLTDDEGNETGERLTIADVNGGLDYIFDADAVALYGYIYVTNTWDDVTVPSNLLRKAQEHLASLIEPVSTIDLSAADLATLDSSATSFHIGTYVTVKSEPHGINQNFMVQKLSINLLNPSSNSLTLGGKVEATFTGQSIKAVQTGGSGGKGEKGDPGLPGTPGADGRTSYFHVKYSANADGNPMSETPDKYIGTYVDFTEADSDDYTKYTWTLFQGSQGERGIPGENGEDGKTHYLHIAYATSADGSTGFSVSDSTNKTYIGQYTDFEEADSTDYTKYKWTKIKGEDGQDGQDGQDGKDAAIQSATPPSDTSYLWLDTSMSPPQLKRYNPDTQTWDIVNDMTDVMYNLEQNLQASITTSSDNILSVVSEQYILKDEANSLVSELSTSIEQTNSQIEFQFNSFKADIESLANNTDAEFENISKYIRFVNGSIVLGEVNNPLELVIEKEQITFKQGGIDVAYFSNNKLHVKDGEYENSLQLGNFAFVPRTNGNLSFKKVK